MAGRTYNEYLTGKLSWVRAERPNQWGDWSIQIHPDAPSLEKVRELAAEGVKNTIKKDEDGYYVTYKRPTSKTYNGKVMPFGPPVVLDGSKPLEGGGYAPLENTGAIGNGSDGIIKLQIYSHRTPSGGQAKAARWESVRIDNLVPFQKQEEFTEEEQRASKGLAEQPKQEQLW